MMIAHDYAGSSHALDLSAGTYALHALVPAFKQILLIVAPDVTTLPHGVIHGELIASSSKPGVDVEIQASRMEIPLVSKDGGLTEEECEALSVGVGAPQSNFPGPAVRGPQSEAGVCRVTGVFLNGTNRVHVFVGHEILASFDLEVPGTGAIVPRVISAPRRWRYSITVDLHVLPGTNDMRQLPELRLQDVGPQSQGRVITPGVPLELESWRSLDGVPPLATPFGSIEPYWALLTAR